MPQSLYAPYAASATMEREMTLPQRTERLSDALPENKSGSQESLWSAVKARHENWLRLYGEEDVWTDLQKRRAMFQARWRYQDAVIEYFGKTAAAKKSCETGSVK